MSREEPDSAGSIIQDYEFAVQDPKESGIHNTAFTAMLLCKRTEINTMNISTFTLKKINYRK
jgi:hypothetical protein